MRILETHEHRKSHNSSADSQTESPAYAVDDEHLQHCAADLEGALDAAGHQGEARGQAEGLEQGRQVVLHGGGAAHLGHELQQRGAPQAGEQRGLPKQRQPREPAGPVVGERLLDVGQLALDLVVGEAALAEVVQRGPCALDLAVLDEPPRPAVIFLVSAFAL